MRKQKFYQITTSGRTADINIYGDITGDAELINAWMDTDTGAVSARSIVQEIQELDVDTINVYINSYGGEVAEALAIYSALKRHSASVHTFCDGFACSAATIIFCAGDVRTMGSIALLIKINQSSINAYMAVVNISQDKVQEMMDNATWLTAQECLEYGFATEIADQETDPEHPEQSAFRLIREAILKDQWQVDLSPIMQKLTKLQEQIEALQKKDDDQDPDEDDPDNDDPDDPEEDPDDEDDDKGNTKEKAKRFFNFMFS